MAAHPTSAEPATPAGGAQRVRQAVAGVLPGVRADLEQLVRIPSVSAYVGRPDSPGGADAAAEQVQRSAEAVADLLRGVGLVDVDLLRADRPDGREGAPAVVGRRPAPPGAPTVLLYAHHDVQPPGTPEGWTSPAFEPTERAGRLYGRGTADDKAGVMVHVGALRALLPSWGPSEGVGVVVFVEGEEEVGSPSIADFLARHGDRLTADVVVVADADNAAVDRPSLTTSLRGIVDAQVTVRTLDHAVHSGMYGGPVPDAVTALVRLLDRLRDAGGVLAVPGLESSPAEDGVDEASLRAGAGVLDGVGLLGSGPLAERLWTRPSLTVTALDVPPLAQASNTLQPSATARLSLRVAPGQDPLEAYAALRDHLLDSAPFGSHVEVELLETGRGFAADVTGAVHDAARSALSEAWGGAEVTHTGVGGSIPFVADLQAVMPAATVLLTGVEDPDTRAHGHDESLSLAVLERAVLAEALLLTRLAAGAGAGTGAGTGPGTGPGTGAETGAGSPGA